jgi:sugar phosphate isomerase/epimerase
MLAISTAWNNQPQWDPLLWFPAIRELDLDAVELGYRVTNQQLESCMPLMKSCGLRVVSVHNFCPLPFDEPSVRHPSNHYRLSAIDEKERQRAVQWTCHSVETAKRVGAGVLVIHAGTIEMPDDPSERILKMCKLGQQEMSEFERLRDSLLKKRAASRKPFIDQLYRSLEQLMPFARQRGIKIGLETRYYPTEIPNYEEIGELLSRFHEQGMYYWHDVGHAEVNGRLGIVAHEDFLKAYQDYIIGFHLHGVEGIKDHRAPFAGDFDLETVFPYIRPHHLKVIEAHGTASAEQIRQAVQRLRAIE